MKLHPIFSKTFGICWGVMAAVSILKYYLFGLPAMAGYEGYGIIFWTIGVMFTGTNYKIAVPQFYNNKFQLLLPLNLTVGSPNPDLALVAQKLNNKTYTARTCLTLRMAYNNARLIVRPQSNWLKP